MDNYSNSTISIRQFTILIVLGIIGDSILILPMMLAAQARQDAWLSMLLGAGLGMAVGGVFAAIANRLGRRSLFEVAKQKLGRGVGGFIGLLFLLEYFICSISLLSEMNQFMTTQMMPETPVNAIVLIFLAVIIIAYRYGIEAFARMGELLFPVMLTLFAILILLLLPQLEFANLKPYIRDGISPILGGAVPAFLFVFSEMVILLMLVPYVQGSGKLTKPILKAFALGSAVLVVVVLFSLLVLGPSLMETKYYSAFVLAQKISIGHFLERVEAIIAFLWIITVFYKSLLLFFALTEGITQLLGLKESRMLTIPLGMLLIVSAIVSTPNIAVYNDIVMNQYPWFDFTFCVVLPLLLLMLLLIRGNDNKRGQAQGQGGDSQSPS